MINNGQLLRERYRIDKVIGRGGFATVFLGHDQTFERAVAIKVISSEGADDPNQFFEVFLREAKLVARLLHPNILDVYDYGQVEQEAFLVMPYADGGTLSQRLREVRQLPLDEAGRYFEQTAAGLAYAHARDIVHRDLKPQNLLLFKDGRLVISDFGLAKMLAGSSGMSSTRVAGTPNYMSPEQWAGQAGKPSDIYALGVMLYQMLGGSLPFSGENQSQLFYQHTNVEPPPLLDKRPDLPPAVARLVHQMLAKKPEERPTADKLGQFWQEATRANSTLPGDWLMPTQPISSDATIAADKKPLLNPLDKTISAGDATLTPGQIYAQLPAQRESPPTPPPGDKTGQRTQEADTRRPVAPAPTVAKPKSRWPVILAAVAVVMATALGFIGFAVFGSQSAGINATPAIAPDVTLLPDSFGQAPRLGNPLRAFNISPKYTHAEIDKTGKYLVYSVSGTNFQVQNYYRDLSTGITNTVLSGLPADARLSDDGKFAVLFTPGEEINERTVIADTPVPGQPTPTPKPKPPGSLTLYDAQTGKEVLKLPNVADMGFSLNYDFTPNGKFMLYSRQDGLIGFVDLNTRKEINEKLPTIGASPKSIGSVTGGVTFTSDSNFVVLQDSVEGSQKYKSNYVYDLRPLYAGLGLRDARPVRTTRVIVLPKFGSLAVIREPDSDNYSVYDLSRANPNGEPLKLADLPYKAPVRYNFLGADRLQVYVNEVDGTFALLDANDGHEIGKFAQGRKNIAVQYSDNKNPVYFAVYETNYGFNTAGTGTPTPTPPPYLRTVTFYDARDGKQLSEINNVGNIIGFSADESVMVDVNSNGFFRYYDPLTGKLLFTSLTAYPGLKDNGKTSKADAIISDIDPIMVAIDSEGKVIIYSLRRGEKTGKST